jgi:hypothetical protein
MTVVQSEVIWVKCANQACGQEVAFLKGRFAPPLKTYCEFCCNDVPAPINNTPLDKRERPLSLLKPKPVI